MPKRKTKSKAKAKPLPVSVGKGGPTAPLVVEKGKAPPLPPGHKEGAYKRFFDLGSEKLGAIDSALLAARPLHEICTMLQDEWQVFVDVKPNTLVQQLKRYRDKFIMPRLQHTLQKTANGDLGTSKLARSALTPMLRRLDVLDKMEKLAAIQEKRLEKALLRESTMPTPTDMVNKLLQPYLNTLDKVANLQLETGHIRRAPKVVHAEVDVYASGRERPTFEVEYDVMERRRKALALARQVTEDIIEGEFTSVDDQSSGDTVGQAPAAGEE